MVINRYHPKETPVPEQWLAQEPDHLIMLIESYHENEGIDPGEGGHAVHATLHLVVENQVAEDVPYVRATIERLIREGLSRHESIHAVAAVLAEDIFNLMKGKIASLDARKYRRRLEKLTAKRWKKGKV